MDQLLFTYLNTLPMSVPALSVLAIGVARFGITVYPVLLLLLWFARSDDLDQRRRGLLMALLAVLLALGINMLLNVAIPRPRPFLTLPAHVLVAKPADSSFPSDHAAIGSAIAIMLLGIGEILWGGVALLGVVGIGMARVMVGVHYPSDILGAIGVGALAVVIVLLMQRPLRPILEFMIGVARVLRLA